MRKGVLALIAVVVFAFLCMIPKLGEDMDKKQIGINQIPFTGTLEYWTNGGFQFQKMGTVTIYDKTSQIWFNQISEDGNGNLFIPDDAESPAMPITYNDKGKGYVLGSLRIELPTEPKYLERIQIHYGSMDRLVNDLI